jgi:glycosyltransferase involved in cell wall biosynthesis
VVYLYGRLTGMPYVFEYHSAAFDPAWSWARPIQGFLARHAAANIVTNQHWADVVNGWGAEALVMFDPFLELPPGEPYPVEPGFKVAFVCTFAPDEPVEAVLEAARQLPEVRFYITGDTRKKPASFLDTAPPNVTFTGFLDPNGAYLGLLRATDAVLVLTTRDHTLQLGGCEAVAVGKPLITSDWPYLHQVFRGGAIFAANTADGIRDAVAETRDRHAELSQAIDAFRQESRQEWNDRLSDLRRAVVRQVAERS